ncbi:biotin/lipoyl-binding carrier protein [Aeromicrobium panaciterrae]|uniref:biotin/lipoyl-binding carrier protein n=1 Tax=Aeromicrobium panaciterrae TaxID=363861 RepID=UPI0031DBD71C
MFAARAEIVANVWKIVAREGDQVGAGDVLAILETMKMEIPVYAEAPGFVSKILVEVGQIVQEGDPLIEIDETASA